MKLKKSSKSSSLSPRGNWVVSKVQGEVILDIGFIADLNFTPTLFNEIQESNPNSLVVGLDINSEKLTKLQIQNTLAGDIFKLPIKSQSVDCVIAAEIFEHLQDVMKPISEMERVLKKGGLAIITTPSPYGFFRFIKHWLFSRNLGSRENIQSFLENYDHKIFWEPLSMSYTFLNLGFELLELSTANISFPYLPNSWRSPNWNYWPINRLGNYTCLVLKKNE